VAGKKKIIRPKPDVHIKKSKQRKWEERIEKEESDDYRRR